MPRRRVLIVDDEPDIRGLLGAILDADDLLHDDVADGAEALEHVRKTEYGAVLLDLMMPRVDGFAVLYQLERGRPELLHRIIVLTGGHRDLLARVTQPVFGTMRKPFGARELLDVVRACIEPGSQLTRPSRGG